MKSSQDRSAVALVVLFALLTLGTVLGFMIFRLPAMGSNHAAGIDRVLHYLSIVSAVFLLIGHGLLIYFVLRYARAVPAEDDSSYRRPSNRAQWIGALVPVLAMSLLAEAGVLMLGSTTWAAIYAERPENPLEVEVVGKQFEWIIRYPGADGKLGRTDPRKVHDRRNPIGLVEEDPASSDDIIKRGTLYLPVNRDVLITLRTHDVLHSFFVPPFRVKQDLIPGFPTSTSFRPIQEGTFELACAELCGLGHYRMRGLVHVTTPAEFEQWLKQQEAWFGD